MMKLWSSYHTTNLWRFMIIIIFFENMVIDDFLACLFNVHYLIFSSMVHEYAYFLWIYLEIGLLSVNSSALQTLVSHMSSCKVIISVRVIVKFSFKSACIISVISIASASWPCDELTVFP